MIPDLENLGQNLRQARLDRLSAPLRHHPEPRHRRLPHVRLGVLQERGAELHQGAERMLRGQVQRQRVQTGLRDGLRIWPSW